MRFVGYCWREKQELAGDVMLWTHCHDERWVGRQTIIYIDQLFYDTGCHPNDLPTLKQYRDVWRDKLKNVRANWTK